MDSFRDYLYHCHCSEVSQSSFWSSESWQTNKLTFLRSSGSSIGSKQTHIAALYDVNTNPYAMLMLVKSLKTGTDSAWSSSSQPTVKNLTIDYTIYLTLLVAELKDIG